MRNFSLPGFCSPAVLCGMVLLPWSLLVSAQVVVTPTTYTSTEGGTLAVGDYPFSASTFQVVVDPGQLGLTSGDQITGLAFRMDHNVNVPDPASDSTFTSFEITLGAAATTGSTMGTTFANNFASSTVVRSGGLTVPANAYPKGSSPNAFGPVITFDTPFTYTGGSLAIQIRSSGGSVFIPEPDADATAATGYATTYFAVASSNPSATSGSFASFPIMELTVIPEPATWALLTGISLGAFGFVRRFKKV